MFLDLVNSHLVQNNLSFLYFLDTSQMATSGHQSFLIVTQYTVQATCQINTRVQAHSLYQQETKKEKGNICMHRKLLLQAK